MTAPSNHLPSPYHPQQDRREVQRELWRIEDVLAGLSGRRENYRLTVDWLQNPGRSFLSTISPPMTRFDDRPSPPPTERMLVLSGPAPMVPIGSALSTEVPSPPQWVSVLEVPPPVAQLPVSVGNSHLSPLPVQMEDTAPPRPPLPCLYDYEETPPVVPPLPREASVGRHTSVRGLKRQSERKRDREPDRLLNGDWKVGQKVEAPKVLPPPSSLFCVFQAELRSYLSEPELTGNRRGHQYLQNTGTRAQVASSSAELI